MPYGVEVARPPDLRDYGRILWRRKWYIVIAVIAAVALAVALAGRKQQEYKAQADVLSQAPVAGSGSNAVEPSAMATEINILESGAVRAAVQKQLHDPGSVSAAQEGDSGVVSVTAQSASPKDAITTVNSWANAYTDYRQAQQRAQLLASVQPMQDQVFAIGQQINDLNNQLQNAGSTTLSVAQQALVTQRSALITQQQTIESQILQAQAQLPKAAFVPAVLTPALAATSTGTGWAQAVGLGLGGGLLAGIALAFLFEYLDDSIRTREHLESELSGQLAVLGAVPDLRGRRNATTPAMVALTNPTSPPAEAYRGVRTALHFTGADAPGSLVELTAPGTGQGTTTTVTNLAVLMARAGRQVVLVDANLRHPRLHRVFSYANGAGLTSVMIGDAPLSDALHSPTGLDNLLLLPAGPVPPNPSEMLASPRFVEVMSALREQHPSACILVDSAPLLGVSDGLVVASAASAVVLVASARGGSRRRLMRAIALLRQSNAPLVGVVLNRTGKQTIDGPTWQPELITLPDDRHMTPV